MKIVALISQKGGSGKTTLSLNLAIAASRAGKQVVLIDLDPQQSAVRWARLRQNTEPVIMSGHAPNLAQLIVRDMGFPVTGGAKGTINAFKEQINALAACKLSVGMWDGNRSVEYQGMPFSRIDVWLPTNPDQLMLWPSTLTFSMDFYTTLARHALPIRAEAVRAFAGSARKLDMYFWFNYRLHRLKAPTVLSWNALASQFGGDYARQRDFRKGFADDLKDVLDVFPKLPVKLSEAGMEVAPAGPEVLSVPPQRRR